MSTKNFALISWSILLVVAIFFMRLQDKKFSATPPFSSIVSLELASDTSTVKDIKSKWKDTFVEGKTLSQHAQRGIAWDFLFIVIYAGFLMFYHFEDGYKTKTWTKAAFISALVAGILDILENIGMLYSLQIEVINPVAKITATCAYLKFGLLIFSILKMVVSIFNKIPRTWKVT